MSYNLMAPWALASIMSLDFYITRDPKEQHEDLYRHVGGAEKDEWDAVFFDALSCEPYIHGEDLSSWQERAELRFREVEAGYPLLCRAADYYADAWYPPEEVGRLRGECLRAKAGTKNQAAAGVLSELIRACDEALGRGWGVWLACD